jgi:hypothetical protein
MPIHVIFISAIPKKIPPLIFCFDVGNKNQIIFSPFFYRIAERILNLLKREAHYK